MEPIIKFANKIKEYCKSRNNCYGCAFFNEEVAYEDGCRLNDRPMFWREGERMTYAKELAPNLFNTYDDWLANYKSTCNRLPSESEAMAAVVYFLKKEKDTTDVLERR